MYGFIFDYDGVIVDSERYWPQWCLRHIQKFLPNFTEKDNKKIIGSNLYNSHQLLTQEFNLTASLEEFKQYDPKDIEGIYTQSHLASGFNEFLPMVQNAFDYVCIGTSSKWYYIKQDLQSRQMLTEFDYIVTSDDVEHGQSKPCPDIYLEAAKRMKLAPSNCIVLEDSTNGIMAAKTAGMYCIGIDLGYEHHQDISQADMQVTAFNQIDLEVVKKELSSRN